MFILKGRQFGTFRNNSSIEHSSQAAAPLDVTVNAVSPEKMLCCAAMCCPWISQPIWPR